MTAAWRSHATLGLRRSTTVSLRPCPTRRRFFAWDAHRRFTADDGPALGLRSLAPPLFLERCVRAYSRPDAALRLLQLLRRASTSTPTLDSSKGRRPQPSSFSHVPRFPLRAATRVEPRSVRSPQPRCRFLLVAQVYPTAMLLRARDRPTVSRRSVEPRLTCTGLRTEQRTRHLVRVRCDALASVAHVFLDVDRRRSPPRRPKNTLCRRLRPHAEEEPLRT